MSAFRVRFVAFALFLSGLAGILGCRPGQQAPPAMPPAAVSVIKPVVLPVQHYYEYNGHLDTTQMLEVRARVKGFLTKVHFKEGTEVRGQRGGGFLTIPGDMLYSIDQREYRTSMKKAEAELEKAKADVENWKAQIDLAKAELKRAEQAAASSATAQTEVDRARATLGVNNAQLAAAQANVDARASELHTTHIQFGYTEIRAKIDGRISRTMVDEGNLVGQTEPTLLTTIVRMDELYVYFDVPERDWMIWGGHISSDLTKTVPVEVGVTGEEGYPHKGHIDFRENRVDPGSGTVRIRGRIPNPILPETKSRALYPGLYARVRIPAGPPTPGPVIPEVAIMTGQEGRYIFVVGADNKVIKRQVTLGPQVYRVKGEEKALWTMTNPKPAQPMGNLPPRPGTMPVKSVVSIEKGVAENEMVIVEGLQKARPGAEVAPEVWTFTGPK
jgi:RND family efflux transporter MFP subunit